MQKPIKHTGKAPVDSLKKPYVEAVNKSKLGP